MMKTSDGVNRRSFLKHASVFALAIPTFGVVGCNQARSLHLTEPAGESKNLPWKTTIVGEGERGETLVISGTIYAPDGRTPLPGMTLFVYQTDATGVYTTSGSDNRNTRIHGEMRTNAEGRYEFRTIRPGSYPGSRQPQHIHAYVSGPGYPEYWIDEYHFADDPFVTDDMRKKFGGKENLSSVLTLTRDREGVLRGVRDIVVERCSRNCTGR
jgi:protocatechuate 3,4-dioxygenase beta subunit